MIPIPTATELSPCARCASLQRTCCQRAEVLVTEGDIARIVAAGRATDFVEHRVPGDPAYSEPDDDDPNWLSYTQRHDGSRRVLRRASSGDCTFLGPQGCVLALEVRPLVCRLYPYEYTETELSGIASDYCPTAVLAPHGERMTDVLGIGADDAERWRQDLYAELRRGEP